MANGWSGSDPVQVTDGGSYELGTEFAVNQDITITAIRVWAGASAAAFNNRQGRIWTTAGGQIGNAVMVSTLPTGWSTYTLATPVTRLAGSRFIVSYSSGGNYGALASAFDTAHNSADNAVTALASSTSTNGNGVFTTSPTTFPTNHNVNNFFYGVDIVYSLGVGGANPPSITSMSLTAAGAVATASVVAACADGLVGATYGYDWGDGTVISGASSFSASHTYAASGFYAVIVSVQTVAGLTAYKAMSVWVNAGVLTDSLTKMTQYIFDLLNAQKATLGIQALFYGDQAKIAVTPTVCVDSDVKSRAIDGIPRRNLVVLTVYVLIYHNPVQDTQSTRKQCDQFAEAIEAAIHADPRLGGNVIHSLVTNLQSGYALRSGTQLRSARLTVQGTSQTLLPNAP